MNKPISVSYMQMVAPHFNEISIKLLCALIDEREKHNLPNRYIRVELENELHRITLLPGTTSAQHNARNRVTKDLSTTDNRLVQLVCRYDTGERFMLDLNVNQIIWDYKGKNTTCNIVYQTTLFDGKVERTLEGIRPLVYSSSSLYAVQTRACPTIHRNRIVECEDFNILDCIFNLSADEQRLILDKYCPECGNYSGSPAEPFDFELIQRGKDSSRRVTQYQCNQCNTFYYL